MKSPSRILFSRLSLVALFVLSTWLAPSAIRAQDAPDDFVQRVLEEASSQGEPGLEEAVTLLQRRGFLGKMLAMWKAECSVRPASHPPAEKPTSRVTTDFLRKVRDVAVASFRRKNPGIRVEPHLARQKSVSNPDLWEVVLNTGMSKMDSRGKAVTIQVDVSRWVAVEPGARAGQA